ncbi:hypothetical protein [Nocardioides ganghwensis]|uniref:hypothetical protein n=1 Tax=Nocardioides ganghwensis TaxID=252230 RepID=UPI001F5C0C3C|nr:hypothetical protein [Nocardioides ganghwensis]
MDIEALAVSEINQVIARCPHLKAFISMNDKTPFTDGHVDLYSGLRQSKSDWAGRVPVQVKGRTRRMSKQPKLTHPIARPDLLAYQKDSGVLYLVVAVDPTTTRCTPYYALLSPFAIDSILREVPRTQRQVSVPLKRLPSDPDELERLFALALRTRDQNVAQGFDPILLQRIESFTVHAASELNFDAPVFLAPGASDFALVLHTTDGLSIPLDGHLQIFPADYVERTVEVQIGSGQTTYDAAAVKRIDNVTFEARLSDGLKLSFRSDLGRLSANVTLTLERTLPGRLKTLEFFTALLDTQVITIKGNPSRVEITPAGDESWLRNHRDYLRSLTDLFQYLGVDSHLVEPDQIDQTQARQLQVLHRAFVRGEEIADPSANTARVLQKVGPWHLLFLMSAGSAPAKWKFSDPFSLDGRQQFRWSASEKGIDESMPVTAYDIVDDEHLATMLNMRLGAIVGAYKAIADFPSTFNLANHRVLALISAADASEIRRHELLDAASRLNDWLLAEQNDQAHHHINGWQIDVRRRELSTRERGEIRELKRKIARSGTDSAIQFEVACALLLGDAEEVEYLIGQLEESELQQMQEWPIWRLRKDVA